MWEKSSENTCFALSAETHSFLKSPSGGSHACINHAEVFSPQNKYYSERLLQRALMETLDKCTSNFNLDSGRDLFPPQDGRLQSPASVSEDGIINSDMALVLSVSSRTKPGMNDTGQVVKRCSAVTLSQSALLH